MKSKTFKIGKHFVGDNKKVFIIAEIGVNHEGSFKKCVKLFEKAKTSGANAVKLQTVNPYYNYVKGTRSYKEFQNTDFSDDEFFKLKKIASKLKLTFLTTPGSFMEVDRVVKLGSEAIKVSSGLLTNYPLIKYASKKKVPLIISTGMALKKEIKEAVRSCGINKKVAILKCTSLYPPPDHALNLNSISKFKRTFKTVIGYSDHTTDDLSCLAAVSNGAKIIEKHFTLNKKAKGKDHKISLEPNEFKSMVNKIRRIEIMLGSSEFKINEDEFKNRKTLYRCLVAGKIISKNEKFSKNNIFLKRPKPGKRGLEARFYNSVIGKTSKKKILKDYPILLKNIR
jgi:sialic acid synthase SpsE